MRPVFLASPIVLPVTSCLPAWPGFEKSKAGILPRLKNGNAGNRKVITFNTTPTGIGEDSHLKLTTCRLDQVETIYRTQIINA